MIPEATRGHASASVSSDPAKEDGGVARDHLLHHSRRIDWRFLLPDPSLGRVALVGDEDPTLVEALRRFSNTFSRVTPGPDGTAGREGAYDVVVVRSNRRGDLETASRLLREDGSLYWEVERDRPGRFPATAAARTLLQDIGFRDVRCHWHRPRFQSCVEIVPLQDEDIISYVLGRSAGSWRGALRLAVGRGLRRLGCLGLMVPCWSVVARRASGGRQVAP